MADQARAVARGTAASRRPRRLVMSHPVLLLAAFVVWCCGSVAEGQEMPAPAASTPSSFSTESGAAGRGLHSSTSHLNLSRLCGSDTPEPPLNTLYTHPDAPLHTLINTPCQTIPCPSKGAYVELHRRRV